MRISDWSSDVCSSDRDVGDAGVLLENAQNPTVDRVEIGRRHDLSRIVSKSKDDCANYRLRRCIRNAACARRTYICREWICEKGGVSADEESRHAVRTFARLGQNTRQKSTRPKSQRNAITRTTHRKPLPSGSLDQKQRAC